MSTDIYDEDNDIYDDSTSVDQCICHECKGTFEVESDTNPTHCPLCSIKFD